MDRHAMRAMLGVVAALCLLVSSGTAIVRGLPVLTKVFTSPDSLSSKDYLLLIFICSTMILSVWALAWVEERMKRERAGRIE